MKRTTTTREYDEQGRVTKEVVTEEAVPEPVPLPAYPYWSVCTCGMTWAGCPLHPRWGTTWTSPNITVTSRSANTEDIKKFGDALVRQMRQARAR